VGYAGANDKVLLALSHVIREPELPPRLAGKVSRCLGRLDYTNSKLDDPSAVAIAVASNAISSADAEFERAERLGESASRQLLKYYFASAYEGLRGGLTPDKPGGLMALAKDEPHKSFVTGIVQRMEPIYLIFDNEEVASKPMRLRKEIELLSDKVEDYVKLNAPSANDPLATEPPPVQAAPAPAGAAPANTPPAGAGLPAEAPSNTTPATVPPAAPNQG
jgi:hypothetical protein